MSFLLHLNVFFCLGKCLAKDILCDCNIKLPRPITHPNTYSINLLNTLVFCMNFLSIVKLWKCYVVKLNVFLNIAKT
jgi:hypothetical protein